MRLPEPPDSLLRVCMKTQTVARASRLVTLLAGLVGALPVGCDPAEPAPNRPRLVILYATCSLNKSYLAPYDPSVPFTPHLAEFAREGVVFLRHETEGGQSGTDFAALFSGTQADKHGVYHHPSVLRGELQLITESFAAAGYETHFWSGHRMASFDLGYGQGVAPERTYDVRGARKKVILQEEDPAFRALLEALVADESRHAFVLANFTLTHSPYHKQIEREDVERFLAAYPVRSRGVTSEELDRWLPLYDEHRLALQWDFPAAVRELELSAQEIERLAAVLEVVYQATVARLDAAFGRTLEALRVRGLEDDSLLAFTADHGELLYRENALFQWTHGLELAPEVLDIPWIVRMDGLRAGVYSEVTRSIDVYPTLAGLCGVALPENNRPDGVDLAPVLRGEQAPSELCAFSHTTTLSAEHLAAFQGLERVQSLYPRTDPGLISVRVRKRDLVAKLGPADGSRSVFQVFDLTNDPHETTDLFDPSASEHAELARALERYKERLVEGFERRGAEVLTDEDRTERLRSLGYVR